MQRVTMATLAVALTASGCGHYLPHEGWITLFDGTSLEHWNRAGNADWQLANGVVQASRSVSKGGGFLVSKNSYKDFDLLVEFWASHDANSGVYVRCADPAKITDRTCYEANIFDERKDPTYGTGAIVHRAAVSPLPKAGGKWNVYEIHARGSQITVKLNGAVTVAMDDKELASGPIALQWGQGEIRFRKVLIRPL